MINTGLSIKPQAFAVLHMLQDLEANFENMEGLIHLDTFAWYNGRERGIALVAEHKRHDKLVVVFGEHRRSDGIFVDAYEGRNGIMEPPHWTDDAYEKAYEEREGFNHGAAGKAAKYVLKRIEKWLREKNKAAEEVAEPHERDVYTDVDGVTRWRATGESV